MIYCIQRVLFRTFYGQNQTSRGRLIRHLSDAQPGCGASGSCGLPAETGGSGTGCLSLGISPERMEVYEAETGK